jgi:hypothetical protein
MTARPALRHLATPLAVVGGCGAWLAADYFRIGSSEPTMGLRGWLVGANVLVAVALGAVATRLGTTRARLRLAVVVVPILGGMLGALCGSPRPSEVAVADATRTAAFDGLLGGLGFLPTIVAVIWAGSLAPRARETSLVGEVDRRAPFVVAAASIALATPVAVGGCSTSSWFAIPVDVSLALGGIAAGWLALALAFDARAWARARGWLSGYAALERRDPEDGSPADITDLGIGEGEHVLVERGEAYRSIAIAARGVRGDLLSSLDALRRALLVTATAFAIAASAMGAAFVVAKPVPRGFAENLARAAEREALTVRTEPDRSKRPELPLSCQAYFTLAGGCDARLPEPLRSRVADDLELVRTRWVTGQHKGLDAACAEDLRELLGRRECAAWATNGPT